jgi:hypothetical protein
MILLLNVLQSDYMTGSRSRFIKYYMAGSLVTIVEYKNFCLR